MRALVIYFSVTGTTERVAREIAAGLEASGARVTMCDLRTGMPDDPVGYDLIGIGFPVHWFRIPSPMRDAIRSLGALAGRSAFVFTLSGTYRGAALNRARAALRREGAREIGVFTCHGEGRFLGYARLGYLFSVGHPDERDLAAAREFGAGLIPADESAGSGAESIPVPADPPTHWMYAFERMAAAPWLARAFYSRFFRVDAGRCVRCGVCARECPVGNIAWAKGTVPVWGRDCILCLNCEFICPGDAVRSPLDWAVFRPFLRYNVHRAERDETLALARIHLRRGRVVPADDPGDSFEG